MFPPPTFLPTLSSTTPGLGMVTLGSTQAVAPVTATPPCPGGVTATTSVAGRASARLDQAKGTGRQCAGASVTSSLSAWEETGTVLVATALSAARMEVVEVLDTTRDTTQETTREAWLEVAGCREEPVEVLERLLQRSCPPGLSRSRRRLCPPSVPHCLSNHTLAVSQCHSFTKLFSKNNFMENS